MIHSIRVAGLPLLLSLVMITPVWAGEYFEVDGAAIGGYDPVAYFTELKPVKGSDRLRADHLGSAFYFSSVANRDAFKAHPEQYAPQYGGYCAYGMAKGYKASTDPFAFTVVGDKLYLNYSGTVRALWIFNIPGYVKKADLNWPEVRRQTTVHK